MEYTTHNIDNAMIMEFLWLDINVENKTGFAFII